MKIGPNSLLIFLILSFSFQASWASKARLAALSNPIHLRDPQLIPLYPTYLMEADNFVLFESGQTLTTDMQSGAEGLASYSVKEDSKVFVSLGAQNPAISLPRLLLNKTLATTYDLSQNPVAILYGRKSMGKSIVGGIYYSTKNDKKNELKESSLALSAGYREGYLIFAAHLSLLNSVDAAGTKELFGENFFQGYVGFEMESMLLSIDYMGYVVKEKTSSVETQSFETQYISANFIDTLKKDGSSFFYRVNFLNQSIKNKLSGLTAKVNILPFTIGFETQAASWLTLRSSIQQAFLINQTSDPVGFDGTLPNSNVTSTDYNVGPNNTQVAVGAGLNFGPMTIDGTLSALTGTTATQNLNLITLLSRASLTYHY